MQIEPWSWRWQDRIFANALDGTYFTWFTTHDIGKRDPAWYAWVMRDTDDDIVCWGHLEPFGGSRKAHVARVGIAVAERARGQGLGTQMVAYLCEQAAAMGYCKAWATYHEPNAAAARLFAKLGFVVEGRFVAEELWEGEYVTVISAAKFVREMD